MSYILDALKKAQAERELGRVPPVQETLQQAPASATPRVSWQQPGWWAAGSGIALLGVALGWIWLRPPSTPGDAAPRVSVGVAEPRAAVPRMAEAPVAAPPVVLPPVLPAPPTPAPATTAAPVAPVAPVASVAPAAPAAPTTPIALESLDAPTRARLPPLAIGGSILSPDRSQRMVIINGQVLREGDALAPDVLVQAIDAQGVLLKLGSGAGQRLVRIKP